MAGAYTPEEIPQTIVEKVARGLTKVEPDGTVKPDLAESWNIENGGKTYVFFLRKNLKFSDGTPLISKNIPYSFSDVTIKRPDDYTIVFNLKDAYAPFLVTVSKPIFYHGYIGVGDYTINNVELNGDFLKSIQLLSTTDKLKTETYLFYPTSDALKIAFTLGETKQAIGLTDTNINNVSLSKFPNISMQKNVNYQRLVTIFYNTQDSFLSDKKIRSGLTYALPDVFPDGERVYFPYSPKSKYYNTEIQTHKQDFTHAKLLISSSLEAASSSAAPTLNIKTLSKYKDVADEVKKAWAQVGIKAIVDEVDSVPQDFQVYLGDFNVPKDPDQYTIWHTGQVNNITRFKNLRIDKLLEDGRKTLDESERQRIYFDFQKYLIDESPASFLYFPYEYEFVRK